MCGILGVHLPEPAHRARFALALDILQHRGPDGEGTFAAESIILGHRRLAIIGLGPAGDQPMIDPQSGVALVFNGEIYNYIELRAELARQGVHFTTSTDSEVLLKAWLHWGPEALPKLNGMWAFALWDPRSDELFLCRDRVGVKPLYYAERGNSLCFASEPKALFRLDPTLAEPNAAAIRDLFATSRSHAGASTFFVDVKALPPGHFARVGPDSKLTLKRFWQIPDPSGPAHADADSDTFATLFDSAVGIRLRSDVPVGLTLSGGLDSSVILASASHDADVPLRCFTSVYSDTLRGEEAWAQRAAALANANLQSVNASIADWHDTLEKIVWHMDSPGYSPAVFPLWRIMEQARADGVTVLVEGQGADELLAGYPQYMPYAIAAALRDLGSGGGGRLVPLARGSIGTFGVKWSSLWLLRHTFPSAYKRWSETRGARSVFQPDWLASIESAADPVVDKREPLFARLAADFSQDILPALLHYGDAISMAHGIESRQPFLDYRLIEWVFRTQPALLEGGQSKRPVRDYLRRVGFGVIAERPDKQGYPTPLIDWLRVEGKARIEALLADDSNKLWEILNSGVVGKRLDQALAGNYGALNQLYKIMTIDIWLRQLAVHRQWSEAAPAP
jgi:asparagine synthase (glutamine-hydrolysing)